MVEFITNQEFEKKFDQLFKDSIEVAIGSAFMNLEGLDLLTTYLQKTRKIINKKIRILLSEKFHEKKEMRKKILERLKEIENVDAKVYSKDDSRFHAKIFIFSTNDQINILSGSYNLTGAGIGKSRQINKEGGYAVSGKEEDAHIKSAISFFNENWEESMSCDEFLIKESKQPEPKFKKGDQVYVIANPEKRGVIDAEPIVLKETFLYSIFFSIDERLHYKEQQLCKIKRTESDNIINQMVKNNFESSSNFIQAFTLLKLDNPLTDNLYAFLSSRTEFNSYQFKPVLKFLNSPFQRLLIADEVGVGKTIEAGIIYTELKARKELEKVLIVCPNALLRKWQSEMKSRFDENFEIVKSERLRYILNEVSNGMNITNFRGICSLELLRMEGYLKELKEIGLQFDLVIVDEAHHMRNRGNSFELGIFLSANSEAMILLTATPLHLGNEDFYNLMHILLPDEFKNFDYFQKLVEPNQYINVVYSMLKSNTSDKKEILEILENVEHTMVADRFLKNPDYLLIKKFLNSSLQIDLSKRLEIQNKLNGLNPLSDVYTRTKKKEVMESPKRDPKVIHVQYSSEEKGFYDGVIEYAKFQFTRRNLGNSKGIGFATIMIQRQVASCIPAMIDYLKELLKNKTLPKSTEDDDYIADDSSTEIELIEERLDEQELEYIKKILAIGEKIGDRDSKFDSLIETFNKHQLVDQEEIKGILIFSFFRKTLEYLRKNLSKMGYSVGLIYGGIELEDREKIIEQLRKGEIQILLSSEVGGEGLDFEFCNCMINYDLPWNPMRVEQRIGRLDRYGQKNPKILIYNFSVEGTIETNIFMKLYQRIKIFEKYIGELEGILGKEIRDLTKLVVSTKLTEEEEEKKVEEISQILEKKRIELKEFERERIKFVGQDDFFTEEISQIKKQNRFVSNNEIMNFTSLFLAEHFPKMLLDEKEEGVYVLRANKDFIDFLTNQKLILPQNKRTDLSSLIKKMEHGDITLTFESKIACHNKSFEFITLRHPLIKCIVAYLKEEGITGTVGKVCVTNEQNQGTYLFFTYIVRINGAKSMLEMHTVVINTENLEINRYLGDNFNTIIFGFNKEDNCFGSAKVSESLINACKQKALEHITSLQEEKENEMKQSNDFLINSQMESQMAFFNHKIKLAEKILNETTSEKIKKMKSSEINRLKTELQKRIRDLEKKKLIDISFNLVAGGILKVNAN